MISIVTWRQRVACPGDGLALMVTGKEHSMRSYLASLILGVAVGVVYGLVKVRSPAPPAIALLGLLGMLAGEQAISLVRSHILKSEVQLGATQDRGEAAIADGVRRTEAN
jgi:XapX domain-containing protein